MEEFLKNLRDELLTQNNRITAYPLFIVQQKRRIYGLDSAYTDDFIWQWSEDPEFFVETIEEAVQELKDKNLSEGNFDLYWDPIGYREYWDFVNAHFTEKAAQLYIDQNHYNLNEPRIYVTSQYRCYEFNKVVEHLAGKEIR